MLYNEEQIKKLKINSRNNLIVCVVIFLIFAAAITVSCFYINDSSLTVIKVVDSVLLSILVCYLLYLIIEVFIPNYRKKVLIQTLLSSDEIEIRYTTCDIGKIKTINHTEKVREIYLQNENESFYVYLDVVFENKIEEIRMSNLVKVRQNYIVEIINEKDN